MAEETTEQTLARKTTDFDAQDRSKYDELDEKYGELFEGSVYRELIYFGHTKSCNGLTMALIVLVSQLILYSTFATEANGLLAKDHVNVEINWFDCDDGISIDTLVCEAEILEGLASFGAALLPALLLSSFTLADMLCCVKAMRVVPGIWSTATAIFIFIMECYALYAASLFAYHGSYSEGSLFSAIVNCVGVLFVHDMDEKVYDAFQYIDKKNLPFCCKVRLCKKNVRIIYFVLWAVFCYALLQGVSASFA